MGWLDIMNTVGKIPEAGALRVHLEAAWRESDELKEKIANLANEITSLNKDNRELRLKNEELKAQLRKFDNKTIPIDIGPCSIKKHKDGTLVNGFYCSKCLSLMSEGDFTFSCQPCYSHIQKAQIWEAMKRYEETISED